MPLLLLLVAALSLAQAPPAPVRPLYANSSIRDSLAGGQRAVFSIDVPAHSAARVVIRQEGIDVFPTLRPKGSDLPARGYDMRAGPDGEELVFPPIADTPATWTVIVTALLQRAVRGDFTISLEVEPADDRSRAVAAARQQYQVTSDIAGSGDAKSLQQARSGHAAVAAAAFEAGDKSLAAEATYQCGRSLDLLGEVPDAIEWQRRALVLFRELGRRDREARVLNRLGDLSRKVGEVSDAERYFQDALPLAREARDPDTIADILNNFETGASAKAEDTIRTALELYEKSGDRAGLAEALGFHARMQYAGGETSRALESFRRALPMLHEVQNRVAEARVLKTWAEVEIDRGEIGPALEKLDEALRLSRLIANPFEETKALYVRGLALRKAETMRAAIVKSELRTSYLATVRSYFDLHVDLLQQRGASAAAFEVSERARARTLLEGLAESASKIRKGVDPQLLARQRAAHVSFLRDHALQASPAGRCAARRATVAPPRSSLGQPALLGGVRSARGVEIVDQSRCARDAGDAGFGWWLKPL